MSAPTQATPDDRACYRAYYENKSKLLRGVLVYVLILILSWLILQYQSRTDMKLVAAVLLIPWSVIFLFMILSNHRWRGDPAFVLTKQGFISSMTARELIPWTAVNNVSMWHFHDGYGHSWPMYQVEIDPGFAKTLTPQGFRRWAPARWRRVSATLHLPLPLISNEPNLIFDEMNRRVADAKASP